MVEILTRVTGESISRRRLGWLAGAAALAAAAVPALEELPAVAARKRRVQSEHNIRGKKAIMCFKGDTIRVPRKKRKKYLKRGASRGKCDGACVPNCPVGRCGDDGCGGTCPACASGSICVENVCHACTVSCDSSPNVCGDTLNAALAIGGDIYICPGRYGGGFAPPVNANLYGSGNGNNDAVDVILDGDHSSQVIDVEAPIIFSLTGLRIANGDSDYGGNVYVGDASANVTATNCYVTGGNGEYGSGFYAYRGTLTINDCQIIGNTGTYDGEGLYNEDATVIVTNTVFSGNTADGNGAAIVAYGGTTTVTGCTISDNIADYYGGGISSEGGTLNVTDTTISNNTAEYGGGIYVDSSSGAANLAASVSVTGNTATEPILSGGGIYVNMGVINVNGATVTGNTPDQCIGVAC